MSFIFRFIFYNGGFGRVWGLRVLLEYWLEDIVGMIVKGVEDGVEF